jgi:hypothetical protein
VNDYTYDEQNRLEQVTQQDSTSPGSHVVAEKRVDFTYDLVGNFDVLRRYASLDTSAPVAVTEFTLDLADRIDTIEHRSGSTPGSGTLLAGYDYGWNAASRLTGMDFLPDGVNSPYDYSAEDVTTFTYDNRDQLTTTDRTGTAADESYTYDDNGNRLTDGGSSYTVGLNNRLQSDGTSI